MQWTRIAAASCITLLSGLSMPAVGAVAENAPVTAIGEGTVIGSVEVDYQPIKGLLGKMRESTRSRKWSVRIALEQDGGPLYHVAKPLEIREGAPRSFVLALPANAYRFVDMENALSGGVERQSVPIDVHFRVQAGRTTYIGRLAAAVVGTLFVPLASVGVADFRDVDLALALKDNPGLALDAVETDLMTAGKEIQPSTQSTSPPPAASADTQPTTDKP
jgi:hypothetical protein